VELGLENKKKAMWAAGLGVVALLAFAYQFIPLFMGSSSEPASSAQAAAPMPTRVIPRPGIKGAGAKKQHLESLDPTLRLDLLAASEQTQYEGNGRNIFVSQPDVVIPKPVASGAPDAPNKTDEPHYQVPAPPMAPPIPLKFYGFASSPGEPKRIFLKLGDDVFVAGEGEIVDRRYKVIRITPTAVQIQDVVNSGPPQSIPLTQG
jgi:hypothetical protein